MQGIVRSFRTNIVEGRFFPFLASILVVAMRFGLFYFDTLPDQVLKNDNFLYNPIAGLFSNTFVSFIASTISVFLIAGILYYLNNRFSLTKTRSNLPFVIPLFLLSLHPIFLVMSGSYVSVIFILLAFHPLLESYQKPDPYLYSFRSATLLAVASLFQIYSLFLVPLWWRGEVSMRGPQTRSFISSLFGVVLVYVSAFAVFLFIDDIDGFLLPFYGFGEVSVLSIPDFTIPEWIAIALVFAFFVISMVLSLRAYSRDKVLTLSFMQFLQFLILFLLILQILYWRETLFFFTVSVVFISFLNAYLYTRTSRKSNIYLAVVFIILALLFYFSSFLNELNFSL